MKSPLGFFILVFSLLLLPIAYAQTVAISPARLVFQIYRGETAESYIILLNPSASTLSYRLRPDQYFSWFNFSEAQGTLEPGSQKEIHLEVHPPMDAANGDYSTLIVAETTGPDPSAGISVSLSTAIKVLVTITGKQVIDLAIDMVSIPDTEQGLPAQATLRLANKGNVRVSPQAEVSILRDNKLVTKTSAELPEILPSSSPEILINLTTDTLSPANYTAAIRLVQDSRELASGTADFQLFPYGTFTRAGNLTRVYFEASPVQGGMAKLVGVFQNTGNISERAKLVSEIYLDGTLIGVAEGPQLLVRPGETSELSAYLNLTASGAYSIVSHVAYEGAQTDKLITSARLSQTLPKLQVPLWILLGFSIIGLGTAIHYRKEVTQMARKLIKEKIYYCIDCNRPIKHKGRCMTCNIRAKTHMEAQDKKYE